ncbi:MAG: Subtilisin-like serine protease [Chlorobi bacterium]|nr:Subtilisin-like serine protease [Chlorobiota bacterium]
MNKHYRLILSAFGTSLLFLASRSPLAAQSPIEKSEGRSSNAAEQARIPIASAKYQALITYGVVRDRANGEEAIGHALYVKVRPGYFYNPAAEFPAVAARAGLPVAAASPMALTTMQPDAKVASRMRAMSAGQQERAAVAQEDLRRIIEVYYSPELTPREAIARLRKLPQIEYAEPIFIAHALSPSLPNDSLVLQQPYLDAVKLPEAWEVWKGDTNMVIGIVDVGIDMTHEDLAPNIKENPGEAGPDGHGGLKQSNGIDDDRNGVVDDWRGANLLWQLDDSPPGDTRGNSHGTHVAGYAAAATNNKIGIAGSAYRCKFFPVKVGRADDTEGRLLQPYEGVIYCAKRGFQVINCSFGMSNYSQATQDMITDLTMTYGCAIVAAAGNSAIYDFRFPAGYDHVLGVGAIEVDPASTFRTSWGEQVDVSAPGTGYTTDINNTYGSGGAATSFTSPVVAGALALVRSRFPDLTPDQAEAHIRLTADPIPLPPDVAYKTRLTGYGRLNAYRAVSTDPFSHPAIVIDSTWLADEAGNPAERISVGGHGQLHVRLRNLLGSATNVKVRATLYVTDDRYMADDSAIVDIADTILSTPSLASGQVKVLDGGIPFTVKLPAGDRVRIRFDITADDYTDYQYRRILIYLPYMTARTPKITMSLTDRGRLGFEDYPINTVGDGFQYQGVPFLYEGGVMIASDSEHLLSNIRGGNGSMQQEDFATIEYPNQANRFTLGLSDSAAGDRRIGLEMRMRFVTVDSIPNAIGIELRTRNMSSKRIDSLRVAMFADWDLDSSSSGQGLEYVESPGMPVTFYGKATSQSDFFLMHGLAAPAPIPIFYAIDNTHPPLSLYENFSQAKKWLTLSNGIANRQVPPVPDSSDISIVIGHTIAGFAAGAEDTSLFVIGVSGLAQEARDAMQSLAGRQIGSRAGVGMEPGTMISLLGVSQTDGVATIHIGRASGDARLRVFDIAGRQLADLTNRLARSGTSTIIFDGSALPSGVYYVQLVSSLGTESRSIVLMH